MSGSICAAWDALDTAVQCDARFNTLCFLFLFLPLTVASYWALPTRRSKLVWLTLASLVFYAFWDWRFGGLLILSAVVDFLVGRRIEAAPDKRGKKRWLWVSLAFNLGLLGFFKYYVFAVGNFNGLIDIFGIEARLPSPKLILPLGISFYTFQTLSYTIDVYRGHIGATRDFLKYLAYVSMFPQLVAGPIVRYRTLSDQLDQVPRVPSKTFVATGATMFVIGLFKKVVVADTFAHWIEPYWTETATLTAAEAWLFITGFVIQIYFDFSGYSEMAIGLGALLGLRFPVNFRAPYSALNPADLWNRWHMTLSTFIRDYVYIPLGGNKVSVGRMVLNTYIIFILIGLWHQASWTMILFGAFQATCIATYRFTSKRWDASPRAVQHGLTLALWFLSAPMFMGVDFRAASGSVGADLGVAGAGLAAMGQIYVALFGGHGLGTFDGIGLYAIGAVVVMAFTVVAKPAVEMQFRFTPARAFLVAAALTVCIFMVGTDNSPFLYYQF